MSWVYLKCLGLLLLLLFLLYFVDVVFLRLEGFLELSLVGVDIFYDDSMK